MATATISRPDKSSPLVYAGDTLRNLLRSYSNERCDRDRRFRNDVIAARRAKAERRAQREVAKKVVTK